MRPQALLALAFGLLAAETLAPAAPRLPSLPIEPPPIARRRNRKVSSKPASSRQIRMAR